MNNLDFASRTKRFLNWTIDGLLIGIIWVFCFIIFSRIMIKYELFDWIEKSIAYDLTFTVLPVYFIYYLILEGIFNTTIGKLITKTKLIKINGEKLSFRDITIRTICRLIPFEQLTFLSNKPVGLHDSLSNTRVINRNSKEKRNFDK